jgi:hypothetical protein
MDSRNQKRWLFNTSVTIKAHKTALQPAENESEEFDYIRFNNIQAIILQ